MPRPNEYHEEFAENVPEDVRQVCRDYHADWLRQVDRIAPPRRTGDQVGLGSIRGLGSPKTTETFMMIAHILALGPDSENPSYHVRVQLWAGTFQARGHVVQLVEYTEERVQELRYTQIETLLQKRADIDAQLEALREDEDVEAVVGPTLWEHLIGEES